MAENSGENAGNLPQPQFEIPNAPQEQSSGQEALTERSIEKRQVSEGAPSKQKPQFPVQSPPPVPPPAVQQSQQPAQTDQSAVSSSTAGLQAKDTELIEKEWVERAKHIVAQTQDDPFKQKNEMSKMKADYIKKRFNKTIPLDDSAKK
jgi:hypothetical protein